MTKEQEREALKKIEKIINEAGPDSYIGITFAGIIEQAEENIANDWGCNYKEQYETQTENLKEARADIKALASQYDDLKEQMKTITGALEAAQDKNKDHIKALEVAAETITNYERQHNADKNEIEALEAEIITLKAKLYDLMTA